MNFSVHKDMKNRKIT